jgi:hypothetical protein
MYVVDERGSLSHASTGFTVRDIRPYDEAENHVCAAGTSAL